MADKRSSAESDEEIDTIVETEGAADEVEPAAEDRRPRRKRKRRRWLFRLCLLLVLGLLVWFAPALVARSALRSQILPYLLASYPGTIETPAADLGWTSPVVFRGVVLKDLQNEPLAEVAVVETELPLWKIVTHSGDVGTLRIREPKVSIRARDDGSNLEDVLAGMLSTDAAGERLGLVVEVEKGRIEIAGGDAPARGAIEIATARVVRPALADEPTTVEIDGSLDDGERPGRVELKVTLHDASGTLDALEGELEADDAPVRVLSPMLHRLHPGLDVDARLDGRLAIAKPAAEAKGDESDTATMPLPAGTTLSSDLTLTRLEADMPGVLAERLRLERVELGGEVTTRADGDLDVEAGKLETDVGRVAFDGVVPVEVGTEDEWTVRRMLEVLTGHRHQLTATVDVQNLVIALPKTTRIRDGLRLESGTMRLDSSTSDRDGRDAWMLRATVADLAGRVNETDVRWTEPVHVAVDVPVTDSGPRVEYVACRADFLRVDGRRFGGGVDLDLDCDLDRLRTELGRFVDLGAVELAGRVRGRAKLSESLDEHWNANVDLEATRFLLAWPNRRRWSEPRLVVTGRASGRGLLHAVEHVDEARFDVKSGEDELKLELTRGVAWKSDPSTLVWPVAFEGSGALDRWQTRVAPFVSLEGWDLGGAGFVDGRGLFSVDRVLLRECEAEVRGLRVRGPNVDVAEPLATLRTDAEWKSEGVFVSPTTTLATRTAAVRAVDFRCDWSGGGPPVLSGGTAMRVDLAGVQRWTGRRPSVFGVLSGSAKFKHENPVTKSLWRVSLSNFSTDRPVTGNDPDPLTFDGRLDYHHERDIVAVRKANLGTDGLTVALTGRTTQASTAPNAEVAGELSYDWDRLQPRLRPFLGNVVPTGSGRRRVSFQGPVDFSNGIPADVVANGALDWRAIDAVGVAVGPGELVASLKNGSVAFAPLDLAVSGGRLRTTPSLLSTPAGTVLQLSPGSTLTDARLTPEMTRRWLGLATPLLANSARAEGRLSASVAQLSSPLADWRGTEATGQIVVDTARVQAAPVAGELLGVVQRLQQLAGGALGGVLGGGVNTSIEASRQTVNVRVTRGRVYHDRMEVTVAGVPVTTTGSVGFDNTLDLVAELRLPPEMLGNTRLGRVLTGPLRIPIRGTTSSPQLDASVLTNLAGRLGVDSLRGEIERALPDEIGRTIDRGLQDLFGPRR